jgi:hypothetical protein
VIKIWEDDFNRTVASGWGIPDVAPQDNFYSGISLAASYVSGGSGYSAWGYTGSGYYSGNTSTTLASYNDVAFTAKRRHPTFPTVGEAYDEFVVRRLDANNYYMFRVNHTAPAVVQMTIYRRLAGTFTLLGVTSVGSVTPGAWVTSYASCIGKQFKMMAYVEGKSPLVLSAVDTTFATGTSVWQYSGISYPNTGFRQVERMAFYSLQPNDDIDNFIELLSVSPTAITKRMT